MNTKRWLFLGLALGVGFLVVSFGSLAGQNTDADPSSKTVVSGSAATDQTVNPDPSSDHIRSTANAVAVDPVFEFEPVLEGATVTHEFTIKNTGMDELKILKVRTG
jgi:hypothetical protein